MPVQGEASARKLRQQAPASPDVSQLQMRHPSADHDVGDGTNEDEEDDDDAPPAGFTRLPAQQRQAAPANGNGGLNLPQRNEPDEKKMIYHGSRSTPPQQQARKPAAPQPMKREMAKVGRNDPCPCGSGKKYKYCHGK